MRVKGEFFFLISQPQLWSLKENPSINTLLDYPTSSSPRNLFWWNGHVWFGLCTITIGRLTFFFLFSCFFETTHKLEAEGHIYLRLNQNNCQVAVPAPPLQKSRYLSVRFRSCCLARKRFKRVTYLFLNPDR